MQPGFFYATNKAGLQVLKITFYKKQTPLKKAGSLYNREILNNQSRSANCEAVTTAIDYLTNSGVRINIPMVFTSDMRVSKLNSLF